MVDHLVQWQDLDIRLSQSFSPATAINRKDFFRGRQAALRRVIDAVNQAGQHAVIYGERGVGKTSLANVIVDFIRPFISETILCVKYNCDRSTTYHAIWNSFFTQLGIPERSDFEKIIPSKVVAAIPTDRRIIFVVDEFDRVSDPEVDSLMADTIKTLSDFNVDITLVIVGVADDVDDLIFEHESIERCLKQIQLPRMDMSELSDIVALGMKSAGMKVGNDAITHVCTLSMGLPHYTHALALEAGRAAIDRQSIEVELRDAEVAVRNMVRDAQQTVYKAFNTATYSPRRENTYFKVLLACALAPTDHLGFFRPSDVREPYCEITGKRYDIPGFARQLHELCSDARGGALQKSGQSRRVRFRFTNPMLQPFVIMNGLQQRLVGLTDVKPRNI